jgi:2-amino-4-hydroxy-6-hydroxymethyldihydropteridine diphosphokinase
MSVRVYLGLGGNLGNPAETIHHALALLNAHPHIRVLETAGLYETEPVDMAVSQDVGARMPVPWFINTVAAIETDVSAHELLHACLNIEAQLGRIRSNTVQDSPEALDAGFYKGYRGRNGYASRTLDIDLLFYGTSIMHESNLRVPHPRLHERAFVLVPLLELAPDFVHPVLKTTIHQLALALPRAEEVRPLCKAPKFSSLTTR